MTFGDRLAELVARRESQIVLGLDPDPALLWPRALELAGGADDLSAPPAVRAARAVSVHCAFVIDAVAEECVAVKPQVACFERLGPLGWQALAEVVAHARNAGLLVIADAKRGDINLSARAYAQAFLGRTPSPFGDLPGLGADAMTVSPWLGRDSLEPFVETMRESAAGIFVLVRNSNPGAVELQDRELAAGELVSDVVARMVAELGAGGIRDDRVREGEGGDAVIGVDRLGAPRLTDVGAVVGATAPDHLERLRELMPRTIFLLPGVGAQGGRIYDLAPVFTVGVASGIVSLSRGIVQAHRMSGGDPAAAAKREAARAREQAWALSS